MKLSGRKFNFIFFLTLLGWALLIGIFVTHQDPFRIFEFPWSQKGSYHQNVTLQKYEMLNKFNGAEAVVIGSSTSENYLPADIQAIWGLKAFHAAVPGSQALARLTLLKEAIKAQPGLKAVFYIADFYESNDSVDKLFNNEVYLNKNLAEMMPRLAAQMLPSPFVNWKERFWDIYSNQSVEAAFRQIRLTKKKGEPAYYRHDGVVNTLDDIPYDLAQWPQAGDKEAVDTWLKDKITENWHQYRMNSLKNYVYSERIQKLFHEVLSDTEKSGVKIYFILSPFHSDFLDMLRKDPVLAAGHAQWLKDMKGLKRYPHVAVFTPQVQSIANDDGAGRGNSTGSGAGDGTDDGTDDDGLFGIPMSRNFWRDGVHYNQALSARILSELREISR